MNVAQLFRKLFSRNKAPKTPPSRRQTPSQGIIQFFSNPFAEISSYVAQTRDFLVILNWLGYILLIASLVDYVLILFPPQLTNPEWELQAFTRMVNNAWFLLLSLILIFIPNRTRMRRFELNFLSLLRWILLLGGVVYISLIPLAITNAQRIHQASITTVIEEETARQQQLTNVQEAIENQDIPQAQLERIGDALGLEEIPESDTVKEALIAKIREQKQQLRQEVEATRRERSRELLRRSFRTNLGAFLIGVFLIRLWWEARWLKLVREQSSDLP